MKLLFPTTPTAPIVQVWGNKNAQMYPGSGRHMGVDIGVSVGNPVYAACPGVVDVVNIIGAHGYGRHVILEHGDFQTLYAHLHKIFVFEGQSVEAGVKIGESGGDPNDMDRIDGASTGAHLHFEVILPKLPEGDTIKTILGFTVDPFPYLLKRLAEPATFSGRILDKQGVRVRSSASAKTTKNILGALKCNETFQAFDVLESEGDMWARVWSLREEYVAVTYQGKRLTELRIIPQAEPPKPEPVAKNVERLDEIQRMENFVRAASDLPGNLSAFMLSYIAQRRKELE